MTTIKKITDENNQLVKETYQDIRDTRNTQYIGNFWKYLAFDPSLLKEVWTEVKNLMTKETLIDKKMKEKGYETPEPTPCHSYSSLDDPVFFMEGH